MNKSANLSDKKNDPCYRLDLKNMHVSHMLYGDQVWEAVKMLLGLKILVPLVEEEVCLMEDPNWWAEPKTAMAYVIKDEWNEPA